MTRFPTRSGSSFVLAGLVAAGSVLAGPSAAARPAGPGSEAQPAAAPAPAGPEGADIELTPELRAAGVTELDLLGPHDPPADRFHPEQRDVTPALGGRAIMHIASEPGNLNFALDNSAVIRWIYYDVHAGLLQFSPVTWDYELDVAASYDVEDTLILDGGRGEDNDNIVYGRIEDDGSHYVVRPGSAWNELTETRVPKGDVQSLERGTVFTFELREDAVWHDGHPLDAHDVLFSWEIYANPQVDCDEKRFKYKDIVHAEMLSPRVIRFFWKEQYFGTTGAMGLDFCILPSHLYDLLDPDNADHDPEAGLSRQAEYINDNPHNIDWVGLGPYRITQWNKGQFIEARRFDDYWHDDPARAGYLDTIRWRYVGDDDVAWQALLNGELDIFYRVKSEDFFGEATRSPVFLESFYKAFTYVGNIGYTCWNLYRDKFKDPRVRQALAHAFDVQKWIEINYKNHALWSTNTQLWFGPNYNHDVEPLPYDPYMAEDLLLEAGWYDRDGNGIVDKDGEDFVIEVLMPTGNKASERFLQALQDAYGQVGIGVEIQPREWASFLERILDRDFDACNLAWTLPTPESDPKQIWHSEEAEFEKRSSNHAGLADAEVDRLIDAGRRELDPDRRHEIFQELHARIYELQPYLFGWNVPRKIAINKKLRGVKLYKFEPGFRLRDMYYEEGTLGTRPLSQVSR